MDTLKDILINIGLPTAYVFFLIVLAFFIREIPKFMNDYYSWQKKVKWTPNTGPLDRGVFVKALPHFNRSRFLPGRARPGSGRPGTDGDAPRDQTGSQPRGQTPDHNTL
jgi:hypothetical protein